MLDALNTSRITAIAETRRLAASESSAAASTRGESSPRSGIELPVAEFRVPEMPELERLAESITQFARSLNRDLAFSVHEASGHTVVKVLDGETKEVIRQIPSEEFLRMAEALAESRSAHLLDVKV